MKHQAPLGAWLAPGGDGVTRDISLNGTGGDVVEAAPALWNVTQHPWIKWKPCVWVPCHDGAVDSCLGTDLHFQIALISVLSQDMDTPTLPRCNFYHKTPLISTGQIWTTVSETKVNPSTLYFLILCDFSMKKIKDAEMNFQTEI